MKCLCFCYLGLELALTRGPVALLGELAPDAHASIRTGALALTSATAAFCFVARAPGVDRRLASPGGPALLHPRNGKTPGREETV